MKLFYRIVSYIIFALNALLVFLWFTQEKLVIPAWLQPIGRMHPMILHLPIGFFVMGVIIVVMRSQFKSKAFKISIKLIFILSALSLVIAALAGLILSKEGGYDNETLKGHLNAGLVLSIVTAMLAATTFKKLLTLTQHSFVTIGFILLVVTGHYGATLTHGENYLTGGKSDSENSFQSDSITVFAKAVLPVLDKKCTSCHNAKKKKGELILTNESDILKGGENGLIINYEKLSESELLSRVHLDLEHDDHMPPFGKPQLTSSEIKLLELWISNGADFKMLWKNLPNKDSLGLMANRVLSTYEKPVAVSYAFDYAAPEDIKLLNTPFRSVSQIATSAPALQASFYLKQLYSAKALKALESVQTQITELNLSGMPITDDDIDFILKFKNLEVLNLNNTNITDKGAVQLNALNNLHSLALSGCDLTMNSLKLLANHTSLQEVFIWNTSVAEADLQSLNKLNDAIQWDIGYQPDPNEILKLTPPILKNETFLLAASEPIILKHNLPGTSIRFTKDGSDPDSITSEIYTKPISIANHFTLKTLATKAGWRKSNTLEYNFFVKGIKPTKTELRSSPSKDYKAKGATSLIDNNIGDADNFRDGNWLGYRYENFVAQFTFKKDSIPNKLTLIYNKNIGSYLMPPELMEIWGGESESTLRLLDKITPQQPDKYLPNKTESITYNFSIPEPVIKIIAKPVQKLPKWHSGKGERGWIMISEVIFQ